MASRQVPLVFVESDPPLKYDDASSARSCSTFCDDDDATPLPELVVASESEQWCVDDATPTRTCPTSSDDNDDMMCSFTIPTSTRHTALSKFRVVARTIVVSLRFANNLGARRSYDLDREVASRVIEQIDMDLPRTGHDLIVRAQLGRIRALLLQYAAEDAELGYCQGMSFVASAFTAAYKSQTEAYRRFHRFMGRLRGLWEPGFPLLQAGAVQFEKLVEDRPWYMHMCSLDVHTSMFLPQAWLTSFAAWLPLESLATCLEFLEFHGFPSLMALTIAVLDSCEDTILQQATMDSTLWFLSNLKSQNLQAKSLKTNAKALLPQIFAMLSRPRVNFVSDESTAERMELQNGEDDHLFARTNSSTLLQWAQTETVAAGTALLRWAIGDPGHMNNRRLFSTGTSDNASSRVLFVSSTSRNLVRRTET